MKENKILISVLVVVAVVLAGWFFYNKNVKDDFKLITDDEELAVFMQNMDEGDLEEYLAKRDELYSQDIYGGDTPEETLGMYIEALKEGNLELASKYFKLEDQEKEFGYLSGLNNQDVLDIVNVLKTGGKSSCNDVFGWCEVRGNYNGVDILISRFIKNEQTGKWKMESL